MRIAASRSVTSIPTDLRSGQRVAFKDQSAIKAGSNIMDKPDVHALAAQIGADRPDIQLRRISNNRYRGHCPAPSAIRNDDIALHSVCQRSAAAAGRYCMPSMRKAAGGDADILRSSTDRYPVMDICRRLLVANVMDIAVRDLRVSHRQQFNTADVCVM